MLVFLCAITQLRARFVFVVATIGMMSLFVQKHNNIMPNAVTCQAWRLKSAQCNKPQL
jgi:hypothetical protein